MTDINIKTGFVSNGNAKLYYETAGTGKAFVMIHAGVADSRQWNNEFTHFAQHYQMIRYDMRGFGKSEPVDGKYKNLDDLVAVLDPLEISSPAIMMGCSMGGGLAMDFVLTYPERASALIMVDSGPGGLKLDTPSPPQFIEAEKAYEAKDWERLCELETQVWFDGMNRSKSDVNAKMRQFLYDMNLQALHHEAKGLGERLPNIEPSASERLSEISVPTLVIIGTHDIPYMQAAADHMVQHLANVRKVEITNTAHLPNMEKPDEFQQIVTTFLNTL